MKEYAANIPTALISMNKNINTTAHQFRTTGCILLPLATIFVSLVLLAMCWSCSKKTTGPATQEAVADSSVPAARGTFDMLAASYAPWHDISAPIKLEMRQPSKISLSARAVMVRDSAVSISIRVFGFEVGSLYADKDSVIAIVKPNKLAYAQNTSKLLKAAGLTFGDLQSALMGQMFSPGKGTVTTGNFGDFSTGSSDDTTAGTYTRVFNSRRGNISFTAQGPINAGCDGAPVLSGITVDASGYSLNFEYTDPAATEAGTMASCVDVSTTLRNRRLQASLRWNAGDARWNRYPRIERPRIPASYRRVDNSTLLKILGGL